MRHADDEPRHAAVDDGEPGSPAERVPAYGTPESGAPEPGLPEPGAPGSGAPEPGAPAARGPAYGPAAEGLPAGEGYVVRPDARTVVRPGVLAVVGVAVAVGVFVSSGSLWGLVFLACGIPLGKHVRDARRGVVYFAVDAAGVYLGESDDRLAPKAPAAPIRWESIATVVVFEIEERDTTRDSDGTYRETRRWLTAVGVTRPGDPDGEIAHYQVFENYGLDRPALERAVRRYGGGVPVVDGPGV